jgi:CheY-like chemotaxis protein
MNCLNTATVGPYHACCACAEPERRGEARRSGCLERGELSLRVLVAEDDPVSQIVMRALLERAGHCVTVASDGAEALTTWQDGEFDLVFMDIQMPHMDGTEAARAIRELEVALGRPRCIIVAVTAYVADAYRRRCVEAGMDELLTKPVSAEALQWAVDLSTKFRRGD